MFALVLNQEQRHFKQHCCAEMTSQVNTTSVLGASALGGSTDQRVYWSPVFEEYGLLCQPSTEILRIQFCPFCGVKLPDSRRTEWLARLERTGWKEWGDQIPQELLVHGWASKP